MEMLSPKKISEAESNVVAFRRKEKPTVVQEIPESQASEEIFFDQVLRRNQANDERLRREREKTNLQVLHSYRIKSKE